MDCADPVELGSFYRRLLGADILWNTVGSVGVRAGSLVLVAQRVDPYIPPTWPGASVTHLDLAATPDLSRATARAVALGATVARSQYDPRWNVLLDPAGHPFCITTLTPTE